MMERSVSRNLAESTGGVVSELEREKQNVQKVQRLNERIMNQLEQISTQVAATEAEYRMRESSFKDKEVQLEVELKKIEK